MVTPALPSASRTAAASAVAAGLSPWTQIESASRRTSVPSIAAIEPSATRRKILAETFAKAGLSKEDLKQYLFDHARLPAWEFERILRDWTLKPTWDLLLEARLGRIPPVYAESADPNRMVPLVWEPGDFMISVTGDPLRNSAYVFAHNGLLGYPVTRAIRMPAQPKPSLAEK